RNYRNVFAHAHATQLTNVGQARQSLPKHKSASCHHYESVLFMKHRLILPGVIALVLLFAACAPPPPLRDDTLLQDTSLITENTECAPPCWRGITPGVTAW